VGGGVGGGGRRRGGGRGGGQEGEGRWEDSDGWVHISMWAEGFIERGEIEGILDQRVSSEGAAPPGAASCRQGCDGVP